MNATRYCAALLVAFGLGLLIGGHLQPLRLVDEAPWEPVPACLECGSQLAELAP